MSCDKVSINGKTYTLKDSMIRGEGGQAIIYEHRKGFVLKLFKQPSHSSLLTKEERDCAKIMLREYQSKLPAFPKVKLPSNVIVPLSLATTRKKISGYEMVFQKGTQVLSNYANKSFVETSGIKYSSIIDLFVNLHETVKAIHKEKIVIGDFNDLNVLVSNTTPYIIDTDSFQYDVYNCVTFTDRFVDPLKCDPNASTPFLNRPHDKNSDWYAFNIMLMRSLLHISPYGGVYKPKDKTKRVKAPARPLKRINVFNKEVQLPKSKDVFNPFDSISPDLLEHFHKTFSEDKRCEFPLALLSSPSQGVPTIITKSNVNEIVRGDITARRIFFTSGVILRSDYNNELRYVHHKDDNWYINNNVYLSGGLKTNVKVRTTKKSLVMGRDNKIVKIDSLGQQQIMTCDSFNMMPSFDTNSKNVFWVESGYLKKDRPELSGYSETIGNVLSNRTLFWAGEDFGFGFQKANNFIIYFMFDAKYMGINDTIKLPPIAGKLLDATCYFTSHHCWFMTKTLLGNKEFNNGFILDRSGKLLHQISNEVDDDNGCIKTIRGCVALGSNLFMPGEEGLLRLKMDWSIKQFKGTEGVVSAGSKILQSNGGLNIVNPHEIWELSMK